MTDSATSAGGPDWAKLFVLGLGGVLVLAMLYVVVIRDSSAPRVTGKVVAYQVGDPKQLVVTIEVDKAPLAEAECQIATFEANGTSAGRLNRVRVGPRSDNGRITRMTVTVPTETAAVRAAVSQCEVTRDR